MASEKQGTVHKFKITVMGQRVVVRLDRKYMFEALGRRSDSLDGLRRDLRKHFGGGWVPVAVPVTERVYHGHRDAFRHGTVTGISGEGEFRVRYDDGDQDTRWSYHDLMSRLTDDETAELLRLDRDREVAAEARLEFQAGRAAIFGRQVAATLGVTLDGDPHSPDNSTRLADAAKARLALMDEETAEEAV